MSGEHYRFVSMWMARTSYLAAFVIMVIFVSDTKRRTVEQSAHQKSNKFKRSDSDSCVSMLASDSVSVHAAQIFPPPDLRLHRSVPIARQSKPVLSGPVEYV